MYVLLQILLRPGSLFKGKGAVGITVPCLSLIVASSLLLLCFWLLFFTVSSFVFLLMFGVCLGVDLPRFYENMYTRYWYVSLVLVCVCPFFFVIFLHTNTTHRTMVHCTI